jgi:hypothetical protein
VVVSIIALVLGAFFLGQRTPVVVKKKAPAKKIIRPSVTKKKTVAAAPAAIAKRPKGSKIAIVIDDFGYNMNNVETFFDINKPLTFSVLPNLRRSRDVADSARRHGCEVILHLPLESTRKDVTEEMDTIKVGDSRKEVLARLEKDISSIPGLKGVSNHMGSRATEDCELMSEIFKYLKKRNLYFFDSLTSEKSVCRAMAEKAGLRFAKRDVFLDNSNDVESIETELNNLKKLALKRGRAIAICHDRKNTAAALAKMMPDMAKDGINFVYLSEMVE